MIPRLVILLVTLGTAACASKGTVAGPGPRPRPFPGAELPPVVAAPRSESGGPASAMVPALLATAMNLRGTPYRNGGSDPSSGFDCSGFVQWVFAQHGTNLPREVKHQFHAGELIARHEVKPGDLVFFETVSRGASHVGIAIGNGQFVHAPSSRGVVRVENYASGYWEQRWVGARRVAG